MSIIHEDGTGLPDANSYASEARALDYNTLRQNEAWMAASGAKRISRLVTATDYIEAAYQAVEARKSPSQALQWPTEGNTPLPAAIVNATVLLALIGLDTPLMASPKRGVKSVKLSGEGVGGKETVFDDPATSDPFPQITAMLTGIATLRSTETKSGPAKAYIGRITR